MSQDNGQDNGGFWQAYNALNARLHVGANQQRPVDAWAQMGETPWWGQPTQANDATMAVDADKAAALAPAAAPLVQTSSTDPAASDEPVQKSLGEGLDALASATEALTEALTKALAPTEAVEAVLAPSGPSVVVPAGAPAATVVIPEEAVTLRKSLIAQTAATGVVARWEDEPAPEVKPETVARALDYLIVNTQASGFRSGK